VTATGTIVDRLAAADLFYGDCDPTDTAIAVAQLRPIASTPIDTSGRPAWRDVPSTYVVCTDDRAVTPPLQRRMARHATHVVEWPTSHSPFLSRPELVVDLIANRARD
jgi:pimeloyl-ACP methyl ester carboxylesterase